MIKYSSNAISVSKAVILGHLLGIPYSPQQEEPTSNLFALEEIVADSYDLNQLVEQYLQLTGRDISWLKDHRSSRFYARINYALRHSSPIKYQSIELAIEDALLHGLEYLLSNVSTPCRKFTDMAREVAHEVQRMLGFIRFTAPDENTLIARPKLFHNTADLILKTFHARYPHYKIILILDGGALSIEKGQLTRLSLTEISGYLQDADQYTSIWEEYYKSQYIESRKNIPLASKAIPQKYWDWMPEGKILEVEKHRDS